jgi:hypothetical protein
VTLNVAVPDAPGASDIDAGVIAPVQVAGTALASESVLVLQLALSRFVTVTVYDLVAGSEDPAPWLDGLSVTVGCAVAQTVDTWNVALSAVRLNCLKDTPVVASLNVSPSPSEVTYRVLPLLQRWMVVRFRYVADDGMVWSQPVAVRKLT